MKGNRILVHERLGKNEKIFKLIQFRSMTVEKDKNGNLFPDDMCLTQYDRLLRSTSLEEPPELHNIFIGDMSLVGPKAMLVKYLSRYTEEQRHRNDVRPGLIGYAQMNGRNTISWEEKFRLDAYKRSGLSVLDIDVFETHDCFISSE